MSTYQTIRVQKGEHLAIITLNRPEKLNSFTFEMLDELDAALDAIEKDDKILVIIITGEGRAFCVGSDLQERLQRQTMDARIAGDLFLTKLRELNRKIEILGRPVIAAMNGHAIGGGLELALACDLRVLSTKAKIGFSEVKVGTIPSAGGTQRLPRLVGSGFAKELLFLGELIEAESAYRMGIVNRIKPPEEVLTEAVNLAHIIIRRAPLAVRMVKFAVNTGLKVDLESGLDLEASFAAALSDTEDRKEGTRAFAEKRDPCFKGK